MVNPERESASKLIEVEQVLGETARWLKSWHGQVRRENNLTSELLSNILSSQETGFADLDIDGDYFILRVQKSVQSDFGFVDILEFNRQMKNSRHPLMVRFFYESGEFDKLVAVSFGWRLSESEVVYEFVSISGSKINKVAKVTRPGILFPAPDVKDSEQLSRQLTQQLELEFSHKADRLEKWTGKLSFDREPSSWVKYENGKFRASAHGITFATNMPTELPVYEFQTQRYYLPKEIDPVPHIQNIFRVNNPQPLI